MEPERTIADILTDVHTYVLLAAPIGMAILVFNAVRRALNEIIEIKEEASKDRWISTKDR